jgi:asparagine synthase (glutamine-hydrolysing)
MLFVCGAVRRSPPGTEAQAVAAMVKARRSALGVELAMSSVSGAALAHGQGRLISCELGPVQARLWRPVGEGRGNDEAVLEACGESYAARGLADFAAISGAFVCLLVDTRSGAVTVANDRFGICPVYYLADGERLSFASEADALAAEPGFERAIDPQAIYDYVFFHCIPSPRTIYRGMRKLEPASALSWNGKELKLASYWMPRFAQAEREGAQHAQALRERLNDAVGARMQDGCGAFLSGGLDSSSVAGLMAGHAPGASTFTIGFDAQGYDESGYARIAAEHFGTTHHEYFVTPKDVCDSLPSIASSYGEPFGNSSVIPTFHCARFAREHGIKTMLAGDGGDELFAGNTRYVDQQVFERYFSVPAVLRTVLEQGYRLLPWLAGLPLAGKGARYIEQAKMGLPDRLQSYNFLNRFDPQGVFDGGWLSAIDQQAPWQAWRTRYRAPATGDALQRMLYLDWKFTLADNDLVKVNRMCELAGVEVCYPMLDTAVLELSTEINSASLLQGGELRGFYKAAFKDFLPAAIIAKSKHGFGLPFGVWMRNDRALQAMVADAFAGMRRRQIFAPSFLDDALRLFREEAAAGYYGELVWIVTMLEMWLSSHE